MADLKSRVSQYLNLPPSESLPLGDGDNPYTKHGLRALTKSVKSLYVLLTVTITLVLFLLISYLRGPVSPYSPTIASLHSISKNCGTNSREAEAKGCAFDLLSQAWIPLPCIEFTTLGEYRHWAFSHDRKNGSFPYFTDREGRNRIADEEALAQYDGEVWSTWEEHLGHCMFVMRRLARAYNQGIRLDSKIREPGHSLACAELMTTALEKGDQSGYGNVAVKWPVTYEQC